MFIFKTLFWFSFFLCLSTYFIYPLVIWLISKFRPLKINSMEYYPNVSIIISAFNEENSIKEKINNAFAQDYPSNKIEIIVGSDGSTDRTVEFAKSVKDPRLKVFDLKENEGKTAVQNYCVDQSAGDILFFTDAASFISHNAIKDMVKNFADKRVGCVAGFMRFINTDLNITTESQGLYWKYEAKLREIESRLGHLIGVDGPLYAIRRSDYVRLGNNIISDFISPLLVIANGKKTILEKEAFVEEVPTHASDHEIRTRRRITLRGLIGLKEHAGLLNVLKYPALSLQIFFHKVLRWFVGPLVLINFISVLFLSQILFFKLFLFCYLIFLIGTLIGMGLEKLKLRVKLFSIPYYFALVNYAAILGIIDFLNNKQVITWQPVR
jgi:poly-beta-1,6-N-acetyl-D-glucosamine synthase